MTISREGRIHGYPEYRLRTDAQVAPQRVVLLFLRHCGAADQHRAEFFQFVRQVITLTLAGKEGLAGRNLTRYMTRNLNQVQDQ